MKKSGSSHDLSKGLHRKLIIQNQGRSRGDRLSIPASSSKQQQIIIKLTKQKKSLQQKSFDGMPQKQPIRLSQSIATIVPPPELPAGTNNNAFLRRKLAERLNHFNYQRSNHNDSRLKLTPIKPPAQQDQTAKKNADKMTSETEMDVHNFFT